MTGGPGDRDGARHSGGETFGRVVAVAVAVQTIVTLPMLLLGTLAGDLTDDLGFGSTGLGAALALTHGSGALASVPLGRFCHRVGAHRGARLACAGSLVAMVGLAAAARSWLSMAPFLLVMGASVALMQPATDMRLVQSLPASRVGFAFGVKLALGGPGAGLVAGLAVPLLASSLGWRAVFALGAATALALSATMRRPPAAPVAPRAHGSTERRDTPLRPLVIIAAGVSLATTAQTSFLGFFVSTSADAGLSSSAAGAVFALGCGAAVASRLYAGRVADRRPHVVIPVVVALLVSSSAGFGLLAWGRVGAIVAAAPLLCVTIWGWQGLLFFAVVRASPNVPARASAMLGAGAFTGAVAGPPLFGLLARHSLVAAWSTSAVMALLAATVVLIGMRLMRRERDPGRARVGVSPS